MIPLPQSTFFPLPTPHIKEANKTTLAHRYSNHLSNSDVLVDFDPFNATDMESSRLHGYNSLVDYLLDVQIDGVLNFCLHSNKGNNNMLQSFKSNDKTFQIVLDSVRYATTCSKCPAWTS